MLQAALHPCALVVVALQAFDGGKWNPMSSHAAESASGAESWLALASGAPKAPLDVSGTWENPAGEDVTVLHDRPLGTLQIRWEFNSRITGSVMLRGTGAAVGDGAGGVKLSAAFSPFPLLVGRRRCEGTRIDFSAIGTLMGRGLHMTDCTIVFTWECPGEEPQTGENYCLGLWL